MNQAGHFGRNNEEVVADPLWLIQAIWLWQQICVLLQILGVVLIICHGKTKALYIARNIFAPLSIENTSRNMV